jgi:putative mRNA 3-end processing factor
MGIEEPIPITVKCTEDGVHLDGSVLWLDANFPEAISFVSSVKSPGKQGRKGASSGKRNSQIIATEETVRLLELRNKKQNALVCQYNRPFSIGRLKMELLPAGSVLGSASLYIEHGKDRILYAPMVQPQKSPTVRQMQLKRANTLVIGAYHPDPSCSMPSRRREKDRLIQAVRQLISQSKYPTIYCNELSTAQELTKELSDAAIPLAVHSSIFRINRIYEQYGAKLGSYSLYDPKRTKKKVLLIPMPKGGRLPVRSRPKESPVLFVESSMTATIGPSATEEVTDRYFISEIADGKELREVIQAVSPKEVLVIGPYAKQYCAELKSLNPKMKPLFPPSQQPLF